MRLIGLAGLTLASCATLDPDLQNLPAEPFGQWCQFISENPPTPAHRWPAVNHDWDIPLVERHFYRDKDRTVLLRRVTQRLIKRFVPNDTVPDPPAWSARVSEQMPEWLNLSFPGPIGACYRDHAEYLPHAAGALLSSPVGSRDVMHPKVYDMGEALCVWLSSSEASKSLPEPAANVIDRASDSIAWFESLTQAGLGRDIRQDLRRVLLDAAQAANTYDPADGDLRLIHVLDPFTAWELFLRVGHPTLQCLKTHRAALDNFLQLTALELELENLVGHYVATGRAEQLVQLP